MDSEEFQNQIDEALRREGTEGKGKEVEKSEEEREDGAGETRRNQDDQHTKESQKVDENPPQTTPAILKSVPTRQSKRKAAPPKPFPPPATSTSKLIGPIKIKKVKPNEEASKSKISKATKTGSNKPSASNKPAADDTQAAKPQAAKPSRPPPVEQQIEYDQQVGSSSEEEDDQQVRSGRLWEDTKRSDERPAMRTVGGITLGDPVER
ncbi:uncharacterized protein MELLADRAFT_65812 [Melampsora larici-populina 98AG31]|uniref:Uncharacterized protein n=1 Tax=Melampsora larici-populina (strain 98AG31 / pathotype 3-4-7) TaxID=747676 RepID=F4RWT0_MELLP|nr:uncharacterized protein MELLADRAFT_65812 [Melampsora larici-populina 98AG31]EGG03080.1 hypothetical protein MELLADRAFT_65812 [Melampsora larici-populina 98AG31]